MSCRKVEKFLFIPESLAFLITLHSFHAYAASFAPILLKISRTSLGLAFLIVSSISFVSSFVGFYSQLKCFYFMTQLLTLLALLYSRVLSVLVPFTKETSRLPPLRSQRLERGQSPVGAGVRVPKWLCAAEVSGAGASVHPTKLLGKEVRRVGCKKGDNGEEAEHEDCKKCRTNRWPMQLRPLRSEPESWMRG